MQDPSRAELERWFDPERADDVLFVETVASWPGLRILDYLYANGAATTGEIARGLNMDMREIRDRLEALEDQGVVRTTDHEWETTTDRITLTFERGEGLAISRTIGQPSRPTDESAPGLATRFRRFVESFFT